MDTTHRSTRSSRLLVLLLAPAVLGCTAEDRNGILDQVGAWLGDDATELKPEVEAVAEIEPEGADGSSRWPALLAGGLAWAIRHRGGPHAR